MIAGVRKLHVLTGVHSYDKTSCQRQLHGVHGGSTEAHGGE